jgi:hypothetical protein
VEAAPGNESAAVSFAAPGGDSGSTITGYTVTAYTGSVAANVIDSTANSGTPTSLIHVITGLTNGQTYTFTVTATNSLSPAETSAPSTVSNSVTPSTTSDSDLAGLWNVGAIMAGKDAPSSQACTMTVNQDGTTSGSCSSNGGTSQAFTGNLWVFPQGVRPILTGSNSLSDWLCQSNTIDSVMACTATANDSTGSSFMSVATKQGASYATASDLPGQWASNSLDIVSDNNGTWNQTNLTVSGDGSFTGTAAGSNGSQKNVSGVLSLLPATGELISTSGSFNGASFGYLDAGNTVVAGVTPDLSNGTLLDAQLEVTVKNAGPYTLADLSGEWAENELSSDGSWTRTTIQVYRDGDYIGSQEKSDGTTSAQLGRLAVSSKGVVSCANSQPPLSNCSNVNLVMDAGKTVLSGTQTDTGSVNSMQVFIKSASLFQNATHLGGGWMHSKWFGDFYADSYPWVYNDTLGWLYPTGTSDSSVWFWDAKMKTFWWTNSTVYPWLYRASDSTWIYYLKGSSNPRLFYNSNSKKWERD